MISKATIRGSLGLCAAAGILMAASAARAEVTFAKDIAPIFQKNCQECHRPGEAVPLILTKYEEVRPWAKSIKKAVSERTMPPWHADASVGEWANDRRLSEDEVSKVVAWADAGAPLGNPDDMPPAIQFSEGWKIGKPDAVFEFAEEEQLPADLEDEYRYVRMSTNFKEDRWLKAIECRPGNVEVVHHIIAFAKPRGDRGRGEREAGENAGGGQKRKQGARTGGAVALGGMAPGTAPTILPKGEGIMLPAGADIVFQMHYHKEKGKPATDKSRIGIQFADYVIEKQKYSDAVANVMFQIPPQNPNFEVKAYLPIEEDITLLTVMPHMHLRGKDMKVWVKLPDGTEQDLIWVPKYDFNWQTIYELKKPLDLPKGSKLYALAHYDNSPNNPANPDPNATIRFGEPTTDEMMFAFVSYTLPEEHLKAIDPGNNSITAAGAQ